MNPPPLLDGIIAPQYPDEVGIEIHISKLNTADIHL
jgi:hypothetical protein